MTRLEETFHNCPECRAPWRLHWVYVQESGERKRRWNTCGMTREQLEEKWLKPNPLQAGDRVEPSPAGVTVYGDCLKAGVVVSRDETTLLPTVYVRMDGQAKVLPFWEGLWQRAPAAT